MIKLKLSEIIESVEVFNVIIEQSFKGSLAFKIARLARELNKEMETFNAERIKVVEKYCLRSENNEPLLDDEQNYRIDPNKMEQFNEEVIALLSNEVEINAEKIPMNCIDEFNITPQQIGKLEIFFE